MIVCLARRSHSRGPPQLQRNAPASSNPPRVCRLVPQPLANDNRVPSRVPAAIWVRLAFIGRIVKHIVLIKHTAVYRVQQV